MTYPAWVATGFTAVRATDSYPIFTRPGDNAPPVVVTFDTSLTPTHIAFSNGDLTATSDNASWKSVISDLGHSTGKWYFELVLTGTNTSGIVGCTDKTSYNKDNRFIVNNGSFGWENGYVWNNGAYGGCAVSNIANGHTIGIAVDCDAHKAWVRVDGVWRGDPAAGTGADLDGSIDEGVEWFAGMCMYSSGGITTANFGASAFAHAIPSGFTAWDGTNP